VFCAKILYTRYLPRDIALRACKELAAVPKHVRDASAPVGKGIATVRFVLDVLKEVVDGMAHDHRREVTGFIAGRADAAKLHCAQPHVRGGRGDGTHVLKHLGERASTTITVAKNEQGRRVGLHVLNVG
jgi:hypothetical protein